MDLSVAILMAFVNPQKYKKTILSVAWPWVHMSLMEGSEGAQEGYTEDIIEVMFLFVAKPKRLLCSDILTLWEVAQMERQMIEADGYILLLLSKWCYFQNRYLKKCKLQCIFQATRLHHWILWLCYCLEAISQLHSHCKLACLVMV